MVYSKYTLPIIRSERYGYCSGLAGWSLTTTDFKIEKQLPRPIMKYTKCLSYPLTFSAAQMSKSFLS